MKLRTITTIFSILVAAISNAAIYKGDTKSTKQTKSLAASCSPATAATELDINNTRALIQTGGDMWWNLVGQPQYEIPSGSGNHALFAGALWMGGRDVSGQLKVAAQKFRTNGNDYWPGPLSTTTGEIDPATCAEYDKHFVTFRDEVAEFVAWYDAGIFDAENGTTTQQDNFTTYQIPESILEWPAHGRNFEPYNEDYYLAPFIDRNGDGFYNPLDGDYPGYDLSGENDCREKILNIYGDQNLWWVFNDKGNIHTESGAQAIGMEIRAQAFAFATNDEVNNMTFYNYELVNRSTFSLTETYFGQWVDADLGNAIDDYVGCDVQRGLGYCYNGDNTDEDNGGAKGYGPQPPAIGVDFFQGPFQDNDGLDNPLTTDFQRAIQEAGIPYKGIGIGYGDSIPDNERFGMRKFLYHNNDGTVRGDPRTGVEYYNYLRSFWRDGTRMYYGGTGYINDPDANPDVEADYMFPGDTDPLGWGTGGDPQPEWTEETSGNTPFDRRFMQSAGPFVLQPGAVNNITVGVVWARAQTGGPFASVQAVRKADDKTQALFDNCFRILNGPDAPELVIQEMDRELLIYITNRQVSNNYNESYQEVDPFIIPPDTIDGQVATEAQKAEYATYKFQGYIVYQVKDGSVAPSDLTNEELARPIFQCDIQDGVAQIINFPVDESVGYPIPTEMVNGNDEGITKAFKVTTDAFAQGDNRLVNHKSYYFMALAYAYNNYEEYDPTNPNPEAQTRAFLASRKAATGPILPVSGIPHKIETENGGTVANAEFGQEIAVTRIEGIGNGGNALEMRVEDREKALEAPYYRVLNPTYEAGGAPIKVKVVDPLAIKGGTYTVQFVDSLDPFNPNQDTATSFAYELTNASYVITSDALENPIEFDGTIAVGTENLILDLGISVSIEQTASPGQRVAANNGFISASIEFEDPTNEWLTGVTDQDGFVPDNWILAGKTAAENDAQTAVFEPDFDDWDWYFDNGVTDRRSLDDDEVYEGVLNGTWAPFRLAADHSYGPIPTFGWNKNIDQRSFFFNSPDGFNRNDFNQLNYLHSVDIVITPDQSKWTRVPVIEMGDTNTEESVQRGRLRAGRSLDKNGNLADVGASASTDENSPAYISATGMSWFPGYAVDLETGERLNMAFGESSYLVKENGRDMIWNPTSNLFEGPFSDVRLGGLHYIMVFRNNVVEDGRVAKNNQATNPYSNPANRLPAYDAGEKMVEYLKENSIRSLANVYRAGMWVGLPMITPTTEFTTMADGLVPSEVTVKIRVRTPYQAYATTNDYLASTNRLVPGTKYFVHQGPLRAGDREYKRGQYFEATSPFFTLLDANESDKLLQPTINFGLPMYEFNLDDLVPTTNDAATAEQALELINVVPNPYYAYSQYETDKLDNRVRITNLPERCNINIYTVNGTLVRTYIKDDASTSFVDWDLKNTFKTPISSGVYIIHVEVPGVGERIVKWFGMMRPVDLDAF